MKKIAQMLSSILVVAVLAGCGGGGGGGSTPGGGGGGVVATPTISNLTVEAGAEPKTLEFAWDAANGGTVDHYRLEVDPNGSGNWDEADATDITTTNHALTIPVHLTDWVNAKFRVIAEDAGDKVLAVSNEIALLGSVTAKDATGYFKGPSQPGVWFGCSIALSADGKTLAVGACYENGGGAAYVFTRSGAAWSQQARINASNAGASDEFGYSVALSSDGNTLVVGARSEDSAATGTNGNQSDNSASDSGAVYVFKRSGAAWNQQAYIKASNTAVGDYFGSSVALSSDGNTLAVGAYVENEDNEDLSEYGLSYPGEEVYVFTCSGTVWSQQAYLQASNSSSNDCFGSSLALSSDGSTLAVGAYFEDSAAIGINGDQSNNGAAGAGAVYVFTRSGVVWSQQAYIKASNTGAMDQFGHSVALSSDGNTLAVGACVEASSATGINGDQSNNSANIAGAAYVFTRSGTVWSQEAYIKASNTGMFDEFGYSVALSSDGNTLAVGARGEDSAATGINGNQADNSAADSGAVYVFMHSDGAVWDQKSYVKGNSAGYGDWFGHSAALSSDGTTLSVGAYYQQNIPIPIDEGFIIVADNTGEGAVFLY